MAFLPSYASLILQRLPLLIIRIEFLLAIAGRVELAADKANDEFTFFVHYFFAAAGGDVDAVGVDEMLGDEGEFGEDGGMPLDDVFLWEVGFVSDEDSRRRGGEGEGGG